jgi:hypothetical protein
MWRVERATGGRGVCALSRQISVAIEIFKSFNLEKKSMKLPVEEGLYLFFLGGVYAIDYLFFEEDKPRLMTNDISKVTAWWKLPLPHQAIM